MPLAVLERIPELLALADEIATIGNRNSLSDAGVAVLTAMAAAEGAYYNVMINLASLAALDQSEAPRLRDRRPRAGRRGADRCEEQAAAARRRVRERLRRRWAA